MRTRKWGRARLGEWVFGSAMAWGCLAPTGASDLLSGSTGCCYGTTAGTCQFNGGTNCSASSYCKCTPQFPGGNCVIKPSTVQCPSGCVGPNTGDCDQGSMCPIYYPPPH
jgi:hypothetical protein